MARLSGRRVLTFKSKRHPPDDRLDWRDPDMPVLRDYKMANGKIVNVVDPDYERRYREFMMTQPAPDGKR